MTRPTLLLPLLLPLILLAGAARAGEAPTRARLCPENLPEGVRLPPQPGCDAATRPPRPPRPGHIDLGDGTSIQIGGSASALYGARR
ncbi:hypothetical protein LOK46_04230 [Methylobacterium sp. NMS14P]|uniref:hypothetical protein n=1 Tax=unclassified Methylobacterium TaxID=2615210 RepID=UPI0023593133|nr:hypothetical protein [Methylobacterium sp. NMS14P]WCS26053.1 hypothetical protein LOK46_04230 [Methylobacterium sp. NMS14P]